jgi:hypothetical protein
MADHRKQQRNLETLENMAESPMHMMLGYLTSKEICSAAKSGKLPKPFVKHLRQRLLAYDHADVMDAIREGTDVAIPHLGLYLDELTWQAICGLLAMVE